MALHFSSTRRPTPGAVQRLYAFAPWAKGRSLAQVRKVLKHTPLFFSAWDGGKMVGMGRCASDFTFRAVLWDLIVDPAYSRRGVGSRMVKSFLGHRALRGVESFWLSTTDKQAFYSRFGFKLNSTNIMVLKKEKRR
jgi:predicted N-acetyltransferase YhbS